MANLSLAFDILARDRASGPLKDVANQADRTGRELDRTGDRGKRMGAAIGAGVAAAAVGLAAIAGSSIKAYVEAEKSSLRLDDALKRFPKTADVSRRAFDNLNGALARKTRFDDDATASAQATLAQFDLTGQQILQLTPLLQDYAAKTGKDLPSASTDLGKALLGQSRALKDVGIDFKDTGSTAGNFDQLVGSLRTQVGGFAAVEGKGAAAQAEIMKNQFGEIQEEIGQRMLPILSSLGRWLLDEGIPAIEDFGGWVSDNKEQIKAFGLEVADKTLLVAEGILNMSATSITALAGMTNNFRLFVDFFFAWGDHLLSIAEKAFGWIPGIGEKVSGAREAFNQLGDTADDKLTGMQRGLEEAAEGARRAAGAVGNVRSELAALTDGKFTISLQTEALRDAATAGRVGDGPGRGGPTLARLQTIIAGSGAYVTSTYRSPAQNRAAGGSPTSYHLDRSNPAVDIGGPTSVLNSLFSRIKAAGPWRELLWQVPGHYDHIHVAHSGGMVSPSWPTVPGLRSDERPAILQTGEQVLSRAQVAGGGQVRLHPADIAALAGALGGSLNGVAAGARVNARAAVI